MAPTPRATQRKKNSSRLQAERASRPAMRRTNPIGVGSGRRRERCARRRRQRAFGRDALGDTAVAKREPRLRPDREIAVVGDEHEGRAAQAVDV